MLSPNTPPVRVGDFQLDVNTTVLVPGSLLVLYTLMALLTLCNTAIPCYDTKIADMDTGSFTDFGNMKPRMFKYVCGR